MSDVEPASMALACVVLCVAALLGYREWLDRQGRAVELPAEDRSHFHRRDRRRSTGLSILCVLALGIVIGSRIPTRVGLEPNPLFLVIWLAIFLLIMTLLALALVDWLDLRRYAQRKKTAFGREQLSILQNEIDHWKSQNGIFDDQDQDGGNVAAS